MNEIYLIGLSFLGIAISSYIYYSKKHDKLLYCPIGNDCNDVVRSKYGKTFGIENGVLGIFYYGPIFIYSIATLINGNIFKYNIIHYLIVGISLFAVLFSIYLTIVQAVFLKKWCEYCVTSAIISFLIFLILVL